MHATRLNTDQVTSFIHHAVLLYCCTGLYWAAVLLYWAVLGPVEGGEEGEGRGGGGVGKGEREREG